MSNATTKKLPWNNSNGEWVGGDSRTLYAFFDQFTGKCVVRPGGKSAMKGIGSSCYVRIATRDEAETLWQNPLHEGWKVS